MLVNLLVWNQVHAGKGNDTELNAWKNSILATLCHGDKVSRAELKNFLDPIKDCNLTEKREIYLEGADESESIVDYYTSLMKEVYSYHVTVDQQVLNGFDLFINDLVAFSRQEGYSDDVIGTALLILTGSL